MGLVQRDSRRRGLVKKIPQSKRIWVEQDKRWNVTRSGLIPIRGLTTRFVQTETTDERDGDETGDGK